MAQRNTTSAEPDGDQPSRSKVIAQLSDFFSLYVLIFGAIMVILGFQLVIFGLVFLDIDIVCFAFILLLVGGIVVWVMLQDKVYHRIFYRPAYPSPWVQGLQGPRHRERRT